ncbi:MAG: alpha/beta hydrolase-fold protein [Microbacterium sp.]|uniref:alpha/beta hydrolase n=1 Tax=Microbacterium sp. TaxID=51671 RepID=UPI0039E39FB2
MRRWLLTLELIGSGILTQTVALVGLLALTVLAVRPRHPWRLLLSFVLGTIGGYLLARTLETAGVFEGALPKNAAEWIAAGVGAAAAGVVAALTRPWWRRAIAALLVVVALVMAGLGVNTSYGLTHTLAAILGIQALDEEPLPALTGAGDGDPSTLYETWTAPADMPTKGRVSALSGDEQIPSTGFTARDAAIYLPPAALVDDPPSLPVIVFMMGQPGTPDPTSIAAALDAFAAEHDGLAPIAIVADQLGSINADPACADSTTYGTVSTYFNSDIPEWIRSHLNVVSDTSYWVIGGYSNGGACAFTWGAQHPEVWGSLMDISGNEYPGSEHEQQTIDTVFDGDADAFEAAKPASWLTVNAGSFDGHVAVFTYGDEDETFGPGQQANAALAQDAGFTVYSDAIPGAGHTGVVLDEGLAFAIDALASHLGLAAPAG